VEKPGTGELLPLFLTVMDRSDDPIGRVRAGNEWVVAARLADAVFFWQKDRGQKLSGKVAALDGIAFHQKLGSYGQKRSRLVALCAAMAEWVKLDVASAKELDTAAFLAKADLSSEMVREFTTLQGVIGGVYAREEGLPAPSGPRSTTSIVRQAPRTPCRASSRDDSSPSPTGSTPWWVSSPRHGPDRQQGPVRLRRARSVPYGSCWIRHADRSLRARAASAR